MQSNSEAQHRDGLLMWGCNPNKQSRHISCCERGEVAVCAKYLQRDLDEKVNAKSADRLGEVSLHQSSIFL